MIKPRLFLDSVLSRLEMEQDKAEIGFNEEFFAKKKTGGMTR